MENIRHYYSAFELLSEEVELQDVNKELLEFLKNFDAFEGIEYFLIDSKTVLFADRITGDIISSCKLEELLPQLSNYYYETF